MTASRTAAAPSDAIHAPKSGPAVEPEAGERVRVAVGRRRRHHDHLLRAGGLDLLEQAREASRPVAPAVGLAAQ